MCGHRLSVSSIWHWPRALPTAAVFAMLGLVAAACAGRQSCRPPQPERVAAEERFANSVGIQLQLIQPGTFTAGVGTPPFPLRKASIGSAFYIGIHEVTNRQYEQFFARHTSHLKEIGVNDRYLAPDHPAVFVSWNDADSFCQWLSMLEGRRYRLPTTDEWEYCAQAGRSCRYPWGNDWPPSPRLVNLRHAPLDYEGPDLDGYEFTSPVGSFPPNPWGLFDMDGNVAEHCQNAAILPGLFSRPYRVSNEHFRLSYKHGRISIGPCFRESTEELGSYGTDRFACGFWSVGGDPLEGNGSVGFRIVLERAGQ